jgi:hypothetical protein
MNLFFKKAVLLLLLLCIGLSSLAFAKDIQVRATVDRNQITLVDSLQLSITIQGTQNTAPPELPSLPDFRVTSTGTSSSTQIINFKRSVSITHKYRLTPMNIGQFKIGSVRIRANGKIFATKPITVVVQKPSVQNQSADKSVFVETNVSKKTAYVGEQLIYSFKLFHRIEAKNLDLSLPFGASHFQKEDFGKAKSYHSVINGIQYQVQEISVALFPIKPGKAEIPPAMLDLDIYHRTRSNRRGFFNDPFFGQGIRAEHKVLRSKPLSVEILALPEKNKPRDFKNIIGQFNIQADLGKNDLEVGDTTTLTITVSGKGNIRGVTFPEPDLNRQFKVYPDQPEFKQEVAANQITGQKTFKFALVPLQSGTVTLPSLTLDYFDLNAKDYRQVKTRPIILTVRPSSTKETLNHVQSNSINNNLTKPEIEILAEDILPIHTQLNDFQNVNREVGTSTLIGFISPALLFVVAAFFIRQQKRLTNDVAFYRNQKAYKTASQKLENLGRSQNSESKEFVSELSEILREYIGDKLNMQGKAITAAEVEHKLKESDYQSNAANSTRKLLEKCEALQYTPVSSGNNLELLNESQDIIKNLEKKS